MARPDIKKEARPYLLLILLLLFGIDIVFMGSGAWANYFGFPFRKLIFFLIALYCLVLWIRNSWWTSNELIAISFLSFLFLTWNSIGVIKGIPVENTLKDSLLISGLLFAPAIGSVLLKKNIYENVKQKLFAMTMILALVHIVASVWGNYSSDAAFVVAFMASILDPVSDTGDSGDLMIRPTSEGFRVFWASSEFLLIGLYLALQKIIKERNVRNIVAVMVVLVAIYCTLSRGLYGASFFVIAAIGFSSVFSSNARTSLLFLILGFCTLLMTFPLIALSDPHIIASIGFGREGSDDARNEQTFFLLSDFIDNLFFGKGFGASCSGIIRNDDFPWSYEMSIMAYYMKVGVIGMFFSVTAFFLYMRSTGMVRLNKNINTDFFMLCGLIAGIVFASNTNPYLFSLTGFAFLLFVYTEMRSLSDLPPKNRLPRVT